MARIRTIKPSFWTDEKLAPCDPVTRLVFIGLISQADDAGRLVDNTKLLDGLLFPETDDSSRESIETLIRLERVCRYRSSSGQKLLQIVNWNQHQRVPNPSPNVLPPPPAEDVDTDTDTPPYVEPNENLIRTDVDSKTGSRKKEVGSRKKEEAIHPSSSAPAPDDEEPPTIAGVERFIDHTIVLANRGMNDNPNVGPHAPIEVGHGPSRQAVVDWLEAGMSKEAIETAVYDAAKRYKPSGSRRRISSLTYFRGAVRDEQNRIDANQVEVPHASNVGSRHDGGSPAQGRGEAPRARGKYDHLVERSSPS